MHTLNLKILLATIFLVIFLTGCSLADLDKKAGELLKKIDGEEQAEENDQADPKKTTEENNDKIDIDIKEITVGQKKKIDQWLENNNFNRYGDPAGTMYMGGTPLFDEATGESIERFEYLIKNHPDLINRALTE